MKNLFLLNRSGMSPEVTCRKGRHAIESIVSRFSLASLICLCMLTVGSGNVWGQEYETAYTLSCSTSGSNNSYTGNCDITVSGITWNVGGNSQQNPWRYGGKSLSKQNRYLYSKTAISDDITKIDIAFGANSESITVNSVKLEVYSTAALAAAHGTGDVSSTTISYSASTTRSVTVPAGKSWQSRYYGITMNLTVSGSSNKYITISSITFYKNKAAATPTLTVSKSSVSGLTYVQGSGPSAAQTFTVSGSNLTSNVTVTAPTNFEVSKDGSSYAGSQTITASSTLSATTIYVRLKSGLAVNSYSGNITVASTGATSKTVSLSGSVTAPAYSVTWTINPAAGGTLSATSGTSTTVTPNAAYTYGSPAYTVTSGSATVSQSTNTFTATPTSDCTIRINMVEKPKFTVTLKDDNSTLTQASAGATVTLPTRTGCTGYTFAGWTKSWAAAQTSWTTTAPTIIPAGSYTPSANENLYPVYTKTESGGSASYQLVTAAPADWSGTYLIVDGTGSYCLDGSLATIDANGNYQSVTIEDNAIASTTTIDSYSVTISAGSTTGKYYIQTASGYYIGSTAASSSNGNELLSSTSTQYDNNISYSSGTFTISGPDHILKFFHQTNASWRFRYYKSTTTTNVRTPQLYKKVGGSTTSYISVPACCTDWSTPTVTYSSSLAINASEGVTIGSGTTHGAVTYESSDEDVLTVDADGTIHAVGAGTAHITATWAGDATYCEKSANSNDVTVSGIQVTGTTPVNFGQVYQNAAVANKTIYVTGLGLASAIMPSLPVGSPFSFSPASLAKDCSGATLTISASTATLGTYNQPLTLTSGAFSATVTVKMEVIAKPTATFTDALHELTTDKNGASLNSFNLEAAQGTPVVFPTLANQTKSAGTCEGEYYIFAGWTEGDNNTDPEDHLVTSYTLANGDAKHYYAVWADASGSATYTKLTSNSFKTSPTKYVLGGENSGTEYFLYTYSSTDADLSWGECSSSEAPIQFTLSGTAGALVAQDASGNYLAESSTKKKFKMSSTSATVQLQDDGTIETESFYLRYNHNSGSGGLRYYDSKSSEPAYFYEVSAGGTVHYRTSCCANKVDAPVVTATAVTSTSITLTWPADVKATGWQIEWNGAGGWVTPSGSCTHTVSGLTPNTTYTWRVRATYEDPVCGADVRSGSTTTNQVYHVTYAKGSGTGSCTASGSTTDETGYEAGATVTLQTNGFTLSGNTFAAWTTDDPDVVISSNQFTMPDHDVVITATWTAKADKYFDRMHDQTDASHGGVAETEGTNEGKYYILKEGCNYSVPTAVDRNTGDACQTSHYKLQGWIAASHMKGYPDHMTGEIKTGEETYIFSPTGTRTATGATYYAIWAEVTE